MFMFIMTTMPQIIVLIVMISCYPNRYPLNPEDPMSDVIVWSFWSCFLMIIAVGIVLPSIFEKTSIYIMNVIWTIFDYISFFFIFAVAFYDDTGLAIAITDAISFYLFLVISSAIGAHAARMDDPDEMPIAVMICAVIFVAFCGAICYVFPFIEVGPLSMIVISRVSQFLYPNVMPSNMILNDSDNDDWLKYRVKKWIESAPDNEEMNFRLNCTNMVILDQYYSDPMSDLYNIKKSMQSNIQNDNNIKADLRRVIKQTKYPKYHHQSDDGLKVLKKIMILYIINRLIHFGFPLAIIIYVGIQENWIMDNINLMLVYMGYAITIMYPLCLLSLIPAWMSCGIYRLILPQKSSTITFNAVSTYIGNLHLSVQSWNVLEDIFGNKDIIAIILEYISEDLAILLKKEEMNRNPQKKLVLLGAGDVGKSTIFRQFRYIHGNGFRDRDRLVFRDHINAQIVEQMKYAIEYLEILKEEAQVNKDEDDEHKTEVMTIDDLSDEAKEAADHLRSCKSDPVFIFYCF